MLELMTALALLDLKNAEQTPELLQQLWTLASSDSPAIVTSILSIAAQLPDDQALANLQAA
ncbi:hypothetical protein H1R20_g10710, partial [Candolleomyces eurysporus]